MCIANDDDNGDVDDDGNADAADYADDDEELVLLALSDVASDDQAHLAVPVSNEQLLNLLTRQIMTKVRYVIYPMALFFFCFALQSFLLHVTTALYVRYMDRAWGQGQMMSDGRDMGPALCWCGLI